MGKNIEFKELTNKSKLIFRITFFAIIVSALILIFAKVLWPQPETDNREKLRFQASNLPTLQLGHYALWEVTNNGEHNLIKRFNFVENSLVSLDSSKLTELNYKIGNNAEFFLVTIEQEGDRDTIPNQFDFLKQNISKPETKLSFQDLSFYDQTNTFILATPTDGNNSINELSGLWFTKKTTAEPSLNLSDIESKWTYEAKLINKEVNEELSLGRFSSMVGPDTNASYSLTNPGFNYPGEDFLANLPKSLVAPLNLTNGNYQIVISLEPDQSGQDFTGTDIFLEILSADINKNLEAFEEQSLNVSYQSPELSIYIENE